MVYEALYTKWGRYHGSRCTCGQDWVQAHALPAGFRVVREGNGFVALVGPGLTVGVDEDHLTVAALWAAVTGEASGKTWPERVRIVER
ncbi:hypothetical protein AB0F43_24935 [Kribbella sp. NPDC023972]|uniref:hypothetical protein n=1 Tax=Kribbella sp. NPDC023972 TaxID=3154795 RepID=UPI0033D97CDD